MPSFASTPAYVPKDAPVYFHRVGPDENLETIAARYNVKIASGLKVEPGDIVAIDRREGTANLA
ncbi:MAG: hypothetical protein JW873_02065 [Candidatus Saganbacteria bacterium]|nr:hypothetical protein [Candidatus Saganbacteria bacterium]